MGYHGNTENIAPWGVLIHHIFYSVHVQVAVIFHNNTHDSNTLVYLHGIGTVLTTGCKRLQPVVKTVPMPCKNSHSVYMSIAYIYGYIGLVYPHVH